MEEDFRFHGMIAEASGNAEFFRVFENVQQKSLLCRYKSYDLSGSISTVGHGRIYQALKQGDRQAAQAAMQDHIRVVKTCLLEAMEIDEVVALRLSCV